MSLRDVTEMDEAARLQDLQRSLGRELQKLASGRKAQHEPAIVDDAFQALTHFDALASQLYRLRGRAGAGDPRLARAEEYAADAAQRLIALGMVREQGAYKRWVSRYRAIWRDNGALFALVGLVLVATIMIGWSIGTRRPDLVPVILPQENMENILAGRAWFESLNDSPLFGGFQIARNNIQVSMLAFAASTFFGIGGLAILAFNGLMIGTMLGFCRVNGFDGPLAEFMVSHGILELSIIVAACFAGLLYGSVFWTTPYTGFAKRMGRAGRDAGVVLTGILPWLVLAGAVESFISPRPDIAVSIKLSVGAAIACAFWLWTLRVRRVPH